jgi:hypothetical protein
MLMRERENHIQNLEAELAEAKSQLKMKAENGCCIVEHGWRIKAERDLTEANQAVHGFERINKELHNELAESRKTIDGLVETLVEVADRHSTSDDTCIFIGEALSKHKLKEK